MAHRVNKYGVPCHPYILSLANGTCVVMDVGSEEDWGRVQECVPGDCKDWSKSVGWGNDEGGHIKIDGVIDGLTLSSLRVRQWAKHSVWPYASNYSSP